MDLIYNDIFHLNIEIIINQKLYERKIIDENTFTLVHDFLLRKIGKLK